MTEYNKNNIMAEIHENENGVIMRSHMTLRDYFAGQVLANSGFDDYRCDYDSIANQAYLMADAMMKARK